MSVVRLSWYLCGLFLAAAVVSSMMTVVPEKETAHAVLLSTMTALALAFALIAMLFQRRRWQEPRWLRQTLGWFAALATVAVVLLALG